MVTVANNIPGMVVDGSDFQKVAMTEHELLIVWVFCVSPKSAKLMMIS